MGVPSAVLRGHVAEVVSVAHSPDGTVLLSADFNGGVRVWRVSDAGAVRRLELSGSPHWLNGFLAFGPAGDRLLASDGEHSVAALDLADGNRAWTWKANTKSHSTKLVV